MLLVIDQHVDDLAEVERDGPILGRQIVPSDGRQRLAERRQLAGATPAALATRWAAACVLDSAGVTRTKALGSERMDRKLRDALTGGGGAVRAAVSEFMRPMLSPALVALNRDAFVINERVETTVDLDGHLAASDLDELVLDEPDAEDA